MGNTKSSSIENFSNEIVFQAKKIQDSYYYFIDNEDKNFDNHINRGVSSGISSSNIIYTNKGMKIDIWYDINFVDLLKGRNELIKEWIEKANKLKHANRNIKKNKKAPFEFRDEKNKKIYEENHYISDKDITINEIKNLRYFPKNIYDKEEYFRKNLKTFFNSHGFRGNIDLRRSLINLTKKKSGRCTSGFLIFTDVLKPKIQKIINYQGKESFIVELALSYQDPFLLKSYEQKVKEIKERTRKDKISPIKIMYESFMDKSKYVNVAYQYYNNDKLINSSFKWEIPKDFFKNNSYGDIIFLEVDDLPFDVDCKIDRICRKYYREEVNNVNKPPKFKKSYEIRFNTEDINKIFINLQDIINDFEISKEKNLN